MTKSYSFQEIVDNKVHRMRAAIGIAREILTTLSERHRIATEDRDRYMQNLADSKRRKLEEIDDVKTQKLEAAERDYAVLVAAIETEARAKAAQVERAEEDKRQRADRRFSLDLERINERIRRKSAEYTESAGAWNHNVNGADEPIKAKISEAIAPIPFPLPTNIEELRGKI